MSRFQRHALNWLAIVMAVGVMVLGASMARADALDEIGREVRSRIIYEKMGWAGDKYAPKGRLTKGNCLTFARTAMIEARNSGINGGIGHCVRWTGVEHAYFKTDDGRVLDIMLLGVVSERDLGCDRMLKDIAGPGV